MGRIRRTCELWALCFATLSCSLFALSPARAEAEEPKPDFSALSSVALFEELSQKVWQINIRVRTGFRKEVAVNAVLGVALNDRERVYVVAAPALSLRGMWAGGSTSDDIEVLTRHLARLEAVDMQRLKSMIGNEVEQTNAQMATLCNQLQSVERELRTYGQTAEVLPEVLGSKRCDRDPAAGEFPEPGDASQRVTYLTSIRDELKDEWGTHAANAQVLAALGQSAEALFDEAERLVTSVRSSQSGCIFFLEGFVGYAFQLSTQGLTSDLGGLIAGAGAGLDMPSGGYSLGLMMLTPFDPGLYVSWSASAFD